MKRMTFILTATFILIAASPCLANVKTIQLKDGSVIKGKVTGMNSGVYTIESSSFGILSIHEDEINSIGNSSTINSTSTNTASTNPTMGGGGMQSRISAMQQNIMSNPNMMADIQSLMNDPEIMKAFQDPAFMDAAVNQDVNALSNNPQTQKLMNNPKMKALIMKMQSSNTAP